MLASMAPPHATGDREIGQRVRARRDELRLNQAGLARMAGKSQTWLSGIERGGRGTDIAGLRELAKALGVTVAWLLGEPMLPRPVSEQWALLSPDDQERMSAALLFLIEKFGQRGSLPS